jgi:hypothetical protein
MKLVHGHRRYTHVQPMYAMWTCQYLRFNVQCKYCSYSALSQDSSHTSTQNTTMQILFIRSVYNSLTSVSQYLTLFTCFIASCCCKTVNERSSFLPFHCWRESLRHILALPLLRTAELKLWRSWVCKQNDAYKMTQCRSLGWTEWILLVKCRHAVSILSHHKTCHCLCVSLYSRLALTPNYDIRLNLRARGRDRNVKNATCCQRDRFQNWAQNFHPVFVTVVQCDIWS